MQSSSKRVPQTGYKCARGIGILCGAALPSSLESILHRRSQSPALSGRFIKAFDGGNRAIARPAKSSYYPFKKSWRGCRSTQFVQQSVRSPNPNLSAVHQADIATNLKLQVDQVILGPSQRSAQESAGSESRIRCRFIPKYQKRSQRRLLAERSFNGLQPFSATTVYSVTLFLQMTRCDWRMQAGERGGWSALAILD